MLNIFSFNANLKKVVELEYYDTFVYQVDYGGVELVDSFE